MCKENLRVNVGKSKVVIRCSREGDGDRMDGRLDEKLVEKVESFK